MSNEAISWETLPREVVSDFLKLLQPFSPHFAEELYHLTRPAGDTLETLSYAVWPKFDPALLVESTIDMPVQVNGKLRDVLRVAVDAPAAEIEKMALASEKVRQFIGSMTVKKVIVVPKKIVNIAAA